MNLKKALKKVKKKCLKDYWRQAQRHGAEYAISTIAYLCKRSMNLYVSEKNLKQYYILIKFNFYEKTRSIYFVAAHVFLFHDAGANKFYLWWS